MSKISCCFVNPDNLPVENLLLSVTNAGVVQEIKALHPYWAEKRSLTVYERPPTGNTMVLGAIDAWKSKMATYIQDLKWLLHLEYHRFWSTVLYNSECMDSLVSFLQEANPPYLPPHESRDVQNLYEEIRRLVLIIFSRLVTNKESNTKWMTKEYMGDIIYNNFVFTIPIMWDICLAYGVDNGCHVSRLLQSVYKLQPQYENDTASAISFVNEALKFIILQVNSDYDSEEPPNLPETFKGFSEIRRPSTSKRQDKITFNILRDLVTHLLDTAMTLRVFIEVYPASVKAFRKTNFILGIVQLYEHGVPQLYERLEEVGDETSVVYTEVEGCLDCARAELIDIFKEILAVYKNAILSGDGSIANHVEEYLAVMMDGLSEKLLIKDYHLCYPVHEDLEILKQAFPDIDTVKTDFILQAIYSNLDEPVPEMNGIAPETIITNGGHAETIDNNPGPSIDNVIPDDLRMESLISEVKDILPHLGNGFILNCLKHYDMDSERVINSILEDNLAEPLKLLDQTLPTIPEDPTDKQFLETGIERLNVFDGDEFDIMSRDDVDVTRIHVGKKRSEYRNLGQMMDDKAEIKQLSNIYSKYNMVCDVEEGMYSDEYDDTYDSDGVTPAQDAGADAEVLRRPFVTPVVLRQNIRGERHQEESDDESDEDVKASNSKSKMDFCVNPEEMRARREANFQARRGKGYRPPPIIRSQDVTGKPRGQGQEKVVIENREKKEKHKSSRGNHSRRQGAQWKRSQGMMPS